MLAKALWVSCVPMLLAFTGTAEARGSLGEVRLLSAADGMLLETAALRAIHEQSVDDSASANLNNPLSCDACTKTQHLALNEQQSNQQITIEPAYQKPATQWYGWLTLMVDGLSLLTPSLGVGLVGLAFGPAIVHLCYGNWGRSLLSVVMRPAFALLAIYVGVTVEPGLIVPLLLAPIAIDAAMAWEKTPVPATVPVLRPARAPQTPVIERQPGEFSLAYRGSF